MKCEDFLQKIDDFYFHELSGSEEDLMAEHVATCSHCEDTWLDYKQIEKALNKLSENEVPSSASKQVILKTASNYLENNRKSAMQLFFNWFKQHPIYTSGIAACAMLMLLVYNGQLGRQQNELIPEMSAPAPMAEPQLLADENNTLSDKYEEAELAKSTNVSPLNQINDLVRVNKCKDAKNLAHQFKLTDDEAVIKLLRSCKN